MTIKISNAHPTLVLRDRGDGWCEDASKEPGTGPRFRNTDRLILKGGTFVGGTFVGGTFEGGTFRGGTFWGGTFVGGTFVGGTFEGGTFWGGTFWGGTFVGGTFEGGTFEGGTYKTTPTVLLGLRWPVNISDTGDIQIGCQRHSKARWEAFSDAVIDRMDPEALSWWKDHKALILSLPIPEGK